MTLSDVIVLLHNAQAGFLHQRGEVLRAVHAAVAIGHGGEVERSARQAERTGFVLAVSGAQMYAFKVVQTSGKFKDGDQPWTATACVMSSAKKPDLANN